MLKSIVQLMAGNGIAQFIQFASIPLLTLFYSPTDFGLLAIAIAISGILAVISSLQLNVAIVSLKSLVAVNRLLSSAFMLNVIMLAVSTVLTFLVSFLIYDGEINSSLIFLIVAITFFSSLNNILKGFFVYLGSFSSLSKTFFFRAITIVGLQFLFALTSVDNGLIIGLLAGEVVMFIGMFFDQLQMPSKLISISQKTLLRLWISLKRLKGFVVYGTAQELISVAAFWLPLVIVITLFGSAMGGEYSISARILWPATVLVTGSVAQVLFHQMVNKPKEELGKEFFFSHYIKLFYIPLALIAYYVTPIVFDLILDEQWKSAVELSKYVVLICVIFLYSVPFRIMYKVKQKQKMLMLIEGAFLCTNILWAGLSKDQNITFLLISFITIASFQVLLCEYICRNSFFNKCSKVFYD